MPDRSLGPVHAVYQDAVFKNALPRGARNTNAQGLKAYRQQEWNQALVFFNQALVAIPDDGPSKTMLARCNDYKVNPPPKDWNGAYSMLTK